MAATAAISEKNSSSLAAGDPVGVDAAQAGVLAYGLSLSRPATPSLTSHSHSPSASGSSSVLGSPASTAPTSAMSLSTSPSPSPPPYSQDASGGLVDTEFGFCDNQAFRYTSHHRGPLPNPVKEEPSYLVVLTTYVSYLLLIVLGHMRDFFGKRMFPKAYRHLMESNGYAALNSDFDSFYTRRLKLRMEDCFARPVTGVCGRTVQCLDRVTDDYGWSFRSTGNITRALNISGYNYLGFAASHGGVADAVEEGIRRYGISSLSSRNTVGTLDLHVQAEKLVSKFMGVEDAMVISMGFATNSTTLPAIVGPGSLIISDEFNHTSIRFGTRISGAHIRSFKHNDTAALENLLRECISQGMPRTHRPWKKILVVIEGLYSMEGNLVNLPAVMALKEKYKFYLYVDEAHSIGAIGPNGRGVCDYFGIDPRQVDVHMGTFTKSFGAAGGYIAGKKQLIDRIRLQNHACVYAETLSPPVLTQVIASMSSIMGVGRDPEEMALVPSWTHLPPHLLDGSEGRERLRRLAFNARYLSSGLRKLGFIVYGHRDSPIVPMLIFNPGKLPAFSRLMLDRASALPPSSRLHPDNVDPTGRDPDRPPIVVVVVAYPATPLISSRARFCVSAAHTKADMDDILRAADEIGEVLALKIGKGDENGRRWTIDEVTSSAVDLVAED